MFCDEHLKQEPCSDCTREPERVKQLEKENAELRFNNEILQKKFKAADDCTLEREESLIKQYREVENLEAENAELRAKWGELRTFVTDEMTKDNGPNVISTALINRLCGLCNVASNEQESSDECGLITTDTAR